MTFETIISEIQAESKKVRSEAWRKSGAGYLPRVLNMPTIALFGSVEMIKDQFERHRKAVDAQTDFIESPAFQTLTCAEQNEVRSRALCDAACAMMP